MCERRCFFKSERVLNVCILSVSLKLFITEFSRVLGFRCVKSKNGSTYGEFLVGS